MKREVSMTFTGSRTDLQEFETVLKLAQQLSMAYSIAPLSALRMILGLIPEKS